MGAGTPSVLEGHEQAVWAVLPVDSAPGDLLSASADRTIRLWRRGEALHTFTGHTDVVRGLSIVQGIGFASASNDGSLRVWTLDGACVVKVDASEMFVYSVAALDGGELAAVGEDRTLRLVRDGAVAQAIPHPAPIWAVAALANGDLVTGGADAVARVWTRDPARAAGADVVSVFEASVEAQAVPANDIPGMVGGVDVASLPDESALSQPGVKEGQYKIVRDASGAPTLYTWSMADASWQKVGQVVGGPEGGGGQSTAGGGAQGHALGRRAYKGKMYDFVFDVDIAEGQPPLQLPFNRGDDPYTAAQRFLHEHNLPQEYLDQTAQFIITNAGGAEAAANAPRNVDPFTATGAYVPGQAPVPMGRPVPEEDPLSAQRYRPEGALPASAAAAAPAVQPLVFDSLPRADMVIRKLAEVNTAAGAEALSAEQLKEVTDMALQLQGPGGNHRPTVSVPASAYGNLIKAASWPPGLAFPALDVLRTTLLQPSVASLVRAQQPPLVPILLRVAAAGREEGVNACTAMALRGIVNLTAVPELQPLVGEHASEVLEAAAETLQQSANAAACLAAATVRARICVHDPLRIVPDVLHTVRCPCTPRFACCAAWRGRRGRSFAGRCSSTSPSL